MFSKIILCVSLILLCTGAVAGQGLIANTSFETRNSCTEYDAECAPEAWFKFPPTIIPLDKLKGTRTFSGEYADHVVLENKNRPFSYRVYLYTMLLCPLEKDSVYELEIHLNPIHETHYELGILFSEEELVPGFVNPLEYTPSLVATELNEQPDQVQKNWRTIRVRYTAKGGEMFLTFGNFSKTPVPFFKKTKPSNKEGDLQILLDDITIQTASGRLDINCPQYTANYQLLFATNERHSYKKGVTHREKSELFETPSTADPDVPAVPTLAAEEEEEEESVPVPVLRFELPDIAFDFDRFEIKTVFYPQLDTFILQMQQLQPQEINISGHTDDVGTEVYNLGISEKRANAVKVYIEQHYPGFRGVITAVGKGESEPKNDNLTEANRAKNRRVEIVVR